MWMVFLANLRRVVPCSRTWSELLAVLDPVETARARHGLLRPLRFHHLSLEFTASVMQSTRAIPCLPQAMARDRTHTCTATRLTRAACSATAAVIRGRDPSPRRRINSTGCTLGCGRQVCANSRLHHRMIFKNIVILTLVVIGSINF